MSRAHQLRRERAKTTVVGKAKAFLTSLTTRSAVKATVPSWTLPISNRKAIMACRKVFPGNKPLVSEYCVRTKEVKGLFHYKPVVIFRLLKTLSETPINARRDARSPHLYAAIAMIKDLEEKELQRAGSTQLEMPEHMVPLYVTMLNESQSQASKVTVKLEFPLNVKPFGLKPVDVDVTKKAEQLAGAIQLPKPKPREYSTSARQENRQERQRQEKQIPARQGEKQMSARQRVKKGQAEKRAEKGRERRFQQVYVEVPRML